MLPAELLTSLQSLPGLNLQAFEQVHLVVNAPTSIRINPLKIKTVNAAFEATASVPWCADGFYLPGRPSFARDPLWHAGAYYVQEASSMVLQTVWQQLVPLERKGLRVLDLCAAPGGKSTHLLTLLNEQDVLVSNEVIGSRVNILLENLTRWGHANVIVTNNDPADFSKLSGLFDIMLVDAPCSGSGLFRRDPQAVKEWSVDAVMQCRKRQQRILADIWPALKEDGLLVYTTCSYSPEEDEEMIDWLCSEYGCESLPINFEPGSNITTTSSPLSKAACYRFYPHLVKGEGFFLSVLRKKNTVETFRMKQRAMPKQEIPISELQKHWVVQEAELEFYRHKDTLYAMPKSVLDLFQLLNPELRIRKAGVCVGEWQRNGLQPDHALAMSKLVSDQVERQDLSLDESLAYLRKETFDWPSATMGWQMAAYKGVVLGWVKNLGNRFNNYYPAAWRLRS